MQTPSTNTYCNNCGKHGHLFHQCKMPITSFGIVAFRKRPMDGVYEYLMIRRKDTLGFIDFMRGKYSIYNKAYIMNMIVQMTVEEKERLYSETFDELWSGLWGSSVVCDHYRAEESASRDKWTSLVNGVYTKDDMYTIRSLITESMNFGNWTQAEWGFPKGRRNTHECDYDCAIREFCEETGYARDQLSLLKNVVPFEEIFTGSNYKSYKHKYYVAYMKYENTLNLHEFQRCEVSGMEWNTIDACEEMIRSYNLEKKRLLRNIHSMLTNTYMYADW
jgi:8-oxo-dGTP pyrophosphatase MutT (NUDIX family)